MTNKVMTREMCDRLAMLKPLMTEAASPDLAMRCDRLMNDRRMMDSAAMPSLMKMDMDLLKNAIEIVQAAMRDIAVCPMTARTGRA